MSVELKAKEASQNEKGAVYNFQAGDYEGENNVYVRFLLSTEDYNKGQVTYFPETKAKELKEKGFIEYYEFPAKEKREEKRPDYLGFADFIKDYINSPETEQQNAIKEGCKKFNISEDEGKEVLEDEAKANSEGEKNVKGGDTNPEPSEEDIKGELKQEMQEQKIEDMRENEINFVDDDWHDDWDKIKGSMKSMMNHMSELPEGYDPEDKQKLFFMSHAKDKITGKPQLIEEVMKKFPLIKLMIKKEKDPETKEKVDIQKIFTLGEKVDTRYDGYQADVLGKDFWIYRVVDKGKEYMVLSENKLALEVQELRGMNICVDDFAELTRSLKMKTISNIFIVKEAVSTVQTLTKEELIALTKAIKNYGAGEEEFKDYVFWHKEDNRVYDHTPEYNKLKQAQLLSGKYEGYPLHIMKVGPAGTGKTCEQEADQSKFQEEEGILEGADSRPKALEPSFKEKPADIGYIAKCNRFAMIDELYKMIENYIATSNDANAYVGHLGGLNFLLEQKERSVGSGNNNSAVVKSTGKILVTTNPMKNRRYIQDHIGVIDQTTMSRFLVWVQSKEEQEKAYLKEWKDHADTLTSIYDSCYIRYLDNLQMLEKVSACKEREEMVEIKPFLTIYDSCQQFLSEFDEKRVRTIVKGASSQIDGGMLNIWRPRGLHHAILILDGIIKQRCLFRDYDPSFTAKEEDYTELERILHQMIQGWNTDLNAEEEN